MMKWFYEEEALSRQIDVNFTDTFVSRKKFDKFILSMNFLKYELNHQRALRTPGSLA